MTRSIPDELISQAAELIAAQLGLHFPRRDGTTWNAGSGCGPRTWLRRFAIFCSIVRFVALDKISNRGSGQPSHDWRNLFLP